MDNEGFFAASIGRLTAENRYRIFADKAPAFPMELGTDPFGKLSRSLAAFLRRANWVDQGVGPLRITNPLSAAQEYLRPTLRASLLATLAANQGHGDGPFRLFEVGRVFHNKGEGLPDEPALACGLLAGRLRRRRRVS